jgi:hypothetical protein
VGFGRFPHSGHDSHDHLEVFLDRNSFLGWRLISFSWFFRNCRFRAPGVTDSTRPLFTATVPISRNRLENLRGHDMDPGGLQRTVCKFIGRPITSPRQSGPQKQMAFRGPHSKTLSGAVVFSPPDQPISLNHHFQWWSYVKGANWRHPNGPGSDIKGKEIARSSTFRIATLSPMQSGLASACLPKRSGNSPPAVVLLESYSSGVIPSAPAGTLWQIPSKDTSPTKTPAKTDSASPHPSQSFLPVAMVFMTWPVMCGNGFPTGIEYEFLSKGRSIRPPF